MSPILVIINLLALMVAGLILVNVTRAYKIIFLSAMSLPIGLWFLIAGIDYSAASFGITEVFMMLLRGIFTLGVVSGALACYIATKLNNKDKG